MLDQILLQAISLHIHSRESMPASERKKLRGEITSVFFQLALLNEHRNEHEDDETLDLLDLRAGISLVRYLNPRSNIPRPDDRHYRVFDLRDDEFRQTLRVTKFTFNFLAELIWGDPVFMNRSRHKQRDVAVQLAVSLEWYGGYGNGNSVGRIARGFGIGAGTVSTYVRRVQRALLRHYKRFVKWPSRSRRIASSAYHRERFGLPGAVGMVDGTHVIFSQRPGIDGSLHFNRKCRYSFNVQVVCDEDKRILAVYTGWPGSCNDSSVFAKTRIMRYPQEFFSDGEYLIGDTGYALSDRLIVPYKRPAALNEDNTVFNETLSSARVINENAIGLLKNCFMSLKGLRTQLNRPEDFKHTNHHIFTCAMLHNVNIELNQPGWVDENNDDDAEDEIGDDRVARAENEDGSDAARAGRLLRERLKHNMRSDTASSSSSRSEMISPSATLPFAKGSCGCWWPSSTSYWPGATSNSSRSYRSSPGSLSLTACTLVVADDVDCALSDSSSLKLGPSSSETGFRLESLWNTASMRW